MKCIHCKHDAKLKDRKDGFCPSCKKRFAFEPTRGDPMTDGVFAAAIDRASSGDRVRFTADHVYYEIRRRYRRTLSGKIIGRAILAGIAVAVSGIVSASNDDSVFFIVGLVGAPALFGLWYAFSSDVADRQRFPRAKFDALFRRYTDAHGAPKTFIERKEPSYRRAAAEVASSEEMLSYSFDRAVICDRSETVDLLLANNFHFENNCAVLGIGGYPEHAFETVRKMLRNNPKLVVIALHDASIEGCKLAHRLRNDSAWFKDGARVVDVGLRPAHRKSFPGQEDRLEPTRPVQPGSGISTAEAKWLSHSALALAVVTPEQIIKRLFRSMTLVEDKQHDSDGGGGGGDSGGGSSHVEFGDDADASDGGGDSFG
jgi:hypothetical protein